MIRSSVRLAALAAALVLGGCDALTNEKVVAAALLQSPGGRAGPIELPRVVRAQLFFGERDSDLSVATSELPAGLDGAEVTISWKEGGVARQVALPPGADPGSYWQADDEEPALRYVPGATYTFRVAFEGEEYQATVVAPPPATVAEFSDAPGKVIAAPWEELPYLTLSTEGAREGDLAFYAAVPYEAGVPLDFEHVTSEQVSCTNVPHDDDTAELYDLVVDPSRWEVGSFVLPRATCFPEPGTYSVGLFVGRKGTVSTNLFPGSSVVAGTGEAGAVILE